MDDPALITERLIVRGWRDADFAALHALCTDPLVMQTIGPLHEEAQTRAYLRVLQQRQREHGHTFWALEHKGDGRVLGFCGIIRAHVPVIAGRLEIGWRLLSDCWGRGYAREAAEGSIRWAAEMHPGAPVWAITSIGNIRSQGLMKRLGMVRMPELDFAHPGVDPADPLSPHVTYRLEVAS